MANTQLFVLVLLLCSVLSVISQSGAGLNFTGPGYIACNSVQFQQFPCNFTDTPDCTFAEAQECNVTGSAGYTVSADVTTIYVDLYCTCFLAFNCPDTCEKFDGELPTLPPTTVEYDSNFTGVGSATCPVADLNSEEAIDCFPSVLDQSSCGTCNATIVDENFGYEIGDLEIVIPLPCECLVMTNCPDTCTFAATADVPTDNAPVAAPVADVPTDSAPVTAPVADVPTDSAPVAVPVAEVPTDSAPVAVTAPVAVPTAANVSVPVPTGMNSTVPTAPVRAPTSPVTSPTRPSNNTSSAYDGTGHYFITMAMMMILISFM